MDSAKQVRMVALEGAGWVQHILYSLLQPLAVRLVRESLFHPLDDGGNLFGQAFLLGSRNSCRAFITEGIGIPVLVTVRGETTFMSTFFSLTRKQMFEVRESLFFRYTETFIGNEFSIHDAKV